MIVDNEPIWHSAREAYKKAWTQMQAFEQQADAFWSRDLPAYERWVHFHFGPELTELREVTLAADGKRAFLDRVAYYEIRCGMTPLEGYARVKSEGEGTDTSSEGAWTPDGSFADDARDDEEAERDIFEALKNFASQLWGDQSCEGEAELRMLYEMASEMLTDDFDLDAPDFETFRREFPHLETHRDTANTETNRLKKLYRTLVRILHPDSGRAFSPREQRLWQRAQDAYKNGDSRELEIVLSQVDMEESSGAAYQTLSELRALEAETRRRTSLLEGELRSLRQENCWGFTRKNGKQLKRLHQRVAGELQQALREAQMALASLEVELADLEAAHNHGFTTKKKPRRPKRASVPRGQSAFSFDV